MALQRVAQSRAIFVADLIATSLMKHLTVVIMSIALCSQFLNGKDLSDLSKTLESLAGLTSPPATSPADGFEVEGSIKPVFFDALDWQGKPTKVFAWVGLPENAKASHPVPGIVLVHGGGGTAFKDWVKQWNAEGFAAISIAVEGQLDRQNPTTQTSHNGGWERHQHAGPARQGIYGDSDFPLRDQWMYHAVADTILANSLLRSLPEVNPKKVGIMGVSWGSVITSTVIGIDPRFAFAIPTYGCGGLDKAPNQYGRTLGTHDLYRSFWDPNLRLEKARIPVLWFSWPEDDHFPMDCLEVSRSKVSGISTASLVPKMGHGHAQAWLRKESYAFAKSILNTGKPWCSARSTNLEENTLTAIFESSKPLDSAVLVSTSDTGDTSQCHWVESPASLTCSNGQWTATASLPPGTTSCFINVTAGPLISSSRYIEKKWAN